MAALNARQKAFVEHYLAAGHNATEAAKRAGYSERTAYSQGQRLLKHVEVVKALNEGQRESLERVKVTQDMVLRGLLLEAQREGKDASHSARVNAWSHLGKYLELFTDKVKHGGDSDGIPLTVIIKGAGDAG